VVRRIEPYWYPIALIGVVAAALFAYHLATGFMPPRAAVTILGFPIYWYGIWIVTGVALGAWVVARLATERARRIFEGAVPADVRALPLDQAGLPEEIAGRLAARRRRTLGQVVWEAGLDPRRLGLKKPQTDEALEAVAALPGVDRSWVSDCSFVQWYDVQLF
jgi:hypothetical protein